MSLSTLISATVTVLFTAAPPARVNVVATEYAFDMPATLDAGPTSFVVQNHGREPHHLTLVRLGAGHSLADLLAAMKNPGPPPAWAEFVGGPNAVDPGGTSLATTVNLTPGHYAAVCMIPDASGVPHVMHGMAREITVRSDDNDGVMPSPTDTVTLSDYAFAFAHPLGRGTQRVLVRNTAAQPHELVLVHLAPGKYAADVASWVDHMQGPPPGHFLGGVSAIAPGESNLLALDLPAGNYALLCFLPDAKDGREHAMHGMTMDLTVP